jgi:hypothetical protein
VRSYRLSFRRTFRGQQAFNIRCDFDVYPEMHYRLSIATNRIFRFQNTLYALGFH